MLEALRYFGTVAAILHAKEMRKFKIVRFCSIQCMCSSQDICSTIAKQIIVGSPDLFFVILAVLKI